MEWLNDPQFGQLMEEMARECEKRGAQLILVIAPTLDPVPTPPAGLPILVFNDPKQYPQLYVAAQRTDWQHLDGAGAVEFSRALAEAYAAMAAARAR